MTGMKRNGATKRSRYNDDKIYIVHTYTRLPSPRCSLIYPRQSHRGDSRDLLKLHKKLEEMEREIKAGAEPMSRMEINGAIEQGCICIRSTCLGTSHFIIF
jgi:hypothetical protein